MFQRLFNRRNILRLTAGGTAMSLLRPIARAMAQQHGDGTSQSPEPDAGFYPDVELELIATVKTAQLFAGSPTQQWKYDGRVLHGDAGSLTWLPGSQMPVIRVRNRQRVRILFRNDLPEESIIHWHGLHMPQKMDGHPMYAIAPGQRYVYEFTVDNRAGTYWFHPHPHLRTGIQVYRGLSGLFIVEDDQPTNTQLPSGDHELAWVIQDRQFNADNQLVYTTRHRDMMTGFTGDRIMVNGLPNHVEQLAATAYRVRILNGSNSRFYKLAWSDARPVTIIGTDGGLLASAVSKPYVMLAPAERIELWLDLSTEKPGTELILRSLSFSSGMMMGMGGMGMGGMGMRGGSRLANGAGHDVLKLRINRTGEPARPLPAQLSTIDWPRLDDAINRDNPRRIRLQMGMGTVSLNDRSFEMYDVAEDEKVRAGTTELWEFVNTSGHMAMSHPMHIHNVQFRVIARQQDPSREPIYTTMRDGLVDEGWKDVVIVMPGETVRVLLKFNDHTGLYLYHCHILEHEDLGMMRNYLAEA
jgi:blue copper oxidase